MSEQAPGRSPIGLPVARRAVSLADGIRQAQSKNPIVAADLPKPAALPEPPAIVEGKADMLRARLVELFNNSKVTVAAFYQYSQTAAALSEEYHKARLTEVYPGLVFEELTLAAALDARETPATLDKKIAELAGVKIKKIVYDVVHSTYNLYV